MTTQVVGAWSAFIVADGVLWWVGPRDEAGELVAFDTMTLQERGTVTIRLSPVGVAASTDGVWVLSEAFDGSPYHVTLVDAATDQVRFEADVPSAPMGGANPGVHLAATPGTAWVAQHTNGGPQLDRVDLATGAVTAIPLPVDAYRLAASNDRVWVAAFGSGTVFEVDSATNALVSVAASPGASFIWSITADDTAVWATTVYADAGATTPSLHVVRVDAQTRAVTAFALPAITIAAGDGQLWAQVYDVNRNYRDEPQVVAQVDATTATFVRSLQVPINTTLGYPSGGPTIAVASGYLWTEDGNSIVRTSPAGT